MSTESAKKIVQQMQEDRIFAAEMGKRSAREDRLIFLQQEGFDFTMEELVAAASEMNAVDVVGGRCCGGNCEKTHCVFAC